MDEQHYKECALHEYVAQGVCYAIGHDGLAASAAPGQPAWRDMVSVTKSLHRMP